MGREECGEGRGARAGEADQEQAEDRAADRGEHDAALPDELEDGDREDHHGAAAPQEQWPSAVAVGGAADHGDGQDDEHHRAQHQELRGEFGLAEGGAHIGREVRGHHVVRDVVEQDQADADQHGLPVVGEQFLEAALAGHPGLLAPLLLDLLERGRLLQPEPHVEADQPERSGDVERDAPAPVDHLVLGQGGGQHGDQAGAEGVADEGAEVEPAAEEAAHPVR